MDLIKRLRLLSHCVTCLWRVTRRRRNKQKIWHAQELFEKLSRHFQLVTISHRRKKRNKKTPKGGINIDIDALSARQGLKPLILHYMKITFSLYFTLCYLTWRYFENRLLGWINKWTNDVHCVGKARETAAFYRIVCQVRAFFLKSVIERGPRRSRSPVSTISNRSKSRNFGPKSLDVGLKSNTCRGFLTTIDTNWHVATLLGFGSVADVCDQISYISVSKIGNPA